MKPPAVVSSVPESAKLETLRAYEAAGKTLIPLRGKIPTVKDWVDTYPGQYSAEQLLPGNYGVALRAGDLVIDVDPRNFAPGDQPLERLITEVGPVESTFIVKTGGGGLHIYLHKSADIPVVNQLKEYPGIEFKSAGRQVVGPYSIHPDSGKQYKIVSGNLNKIADASTGLLALISKQASVPFVEVDGTGEYKNDANTQGRYAGFLQDVVDPSVEGRGGDNQAFKTACYGRDLGLSPATTWELMLEFWNKRCSPPWDAEELRVKVINAYKFASGPVGAKHPAADFKEIPVHNGATEVPVSEAHNGKKKGQTEVEEINWVTNSQGTMKKCFQNLVTHLRWPQAGLAKVFGHNEFTGRYEFMNPAPWHRGKMPAYLGVGDNDLKLLKGHLAMKHGYEAEVSNIEEAVTNVAHENRFHPVREYLLGLSWDGARRLDSWLCDYLGVEDTPYTRAVARKTLCAAVMRVMRPGIKFDHVLVFEGLQGIGKSSVCKILGGEWAADFTLDPHNKDSIQLMQGKWIIELAEMETTRRSELQSLKAFISRGKDEARLAYGRAVGEFPRQSIFIGSINPGADGTYLQDDENRRWWPVHCAPKGGQVDFKALKAARNQLWAEAVHVVTNTKEALYMDTPELKTAAKEIVGQRRAESEWIECITNWLRETNKNSETVRDFVTSREVFLSAVGGVDQNFDVRAARKISRALTELGWERGTKRFGDDVMRGFWLKVEPAVKDRMLQTLGNLV